MCKDRVTVIKVKYFKISIFKRINSPVFDTKLHSIYDFSVKFAGYIYI